MIEDVVQHKITMILGVRQPQSPIMLHLHYPIMMAFIDKGQGRGSRRSEMLTIVQRS